MEEISVKVEQQVGTVRWNFEEIKALLAEETKKFASVIYDDGNIKTAKKDLAYLRRLSKDIEDRRKEVKEKCLEPYTVIEDQAKQLVALVNEPIAAINGQVQAYETRRKEMVKENIKAYWEAGISQVEKMFRTTLMKSVWDEKWLNATTAEVTWKTRIDEAILATARDTEIMESTGGEFLEDMKAEYAKSLDLRNAMSVLEQLKAQKERILEMERRRKAEEERKQAEEEQRQAERRQAEEAQKAALPQDAPLAKKRESPQENVDGITRTEAKPAEAGKSKQPTPSVVLRITGEWYQIEKIKGYIQYVGAGFEVI